MGKQAKILGFMFVTCYALLFAQNTDPCSQTTQLTGGTALTMNGNQGMGSLSGTDYHYEAWIEGGNSNDMELKWYGADQGGGAAFYAKWKNPNDYLARIGYYWGGSNGPAYSTLKNVYMDFNYTRSGQSTAGDYSYIGVYGWARNSSASNDEKLVEFYVVEDWFGNQYQNEGTPVGSNTILSDGNGEKLTTTIDVDGSTYDIYKKTRTGPSVDGNSTFTQIFSVRQNQRKCGTISVNEHVEKWNELGGLTFANMYDLKFLVEAGGGEGWFDLSYLKITQEDTPRSIPEGYYALTTSVSPYNGGSVSKNTSDLYHESGSSVTLTATPATGWQFDRWSGDASGTDAAITITMDANKTVTANFVLEDGVNLVKNGEFANADDWTLNQGEYYGNSVATFTATNNQATVSITTLPTSGNVWDIQLVQGGIALIKGNKYVLSFDAYAESARDMEVFLQMESSPWTGYMSEDISLTNQKQQFSFEFEMEAETDENGRLGFNLGNNNSTVYISNVSLVYVADPTKALNSPIKTDFKIHSISNGMLLVESNASSAIHLYSTSGKLVQKAQVSAGSNLVKLSVPNGIYIVKNIKTGQAQKILVK